MDRGVVPSRAAASLRSAETKPSIRGICPRRRRANLSVPGREQDSHKHGPYSPGIFPAPQTGESRARAGLRQTLVPGDFPRRRRESPGQGQDCHKHGPYSPGIFPAPQTGESRWVRAGRASHSSLNICRTLDKCWSASCRGGFGGRYRRKTDLDPKPQSVGMGAGPSAFGHRILC